jgi:Uncharacterised nucleotidyltransferase
MSSARLIELLRQPEAVATVSDSEWNGLVVAARKTQLLGQLVARLRKAGRLDLAPLAVRRHLDLEALSCRRRGESALWEIATMRRAVDAQYPLVLLKGCAYLVAQDANAEGRPFSDIDVMVHRNELPAVETNLVAVGWKPGSVNAYDAAYYRNWMHEVPPMAHVRRHTVVDLHHAINPPISRYYIDPAKLFEKLTSVSPGVYVLSATDRTIHCALHLLQEGEPRKLLRDLYDLYLLIEQHHGGAEGMAALMARADGLGVRKPLAVAVDASLAIFGGNDAKSPALGSLAKAVSHAALVAHDPAGLTANLAANLVLAHSHWMKMPMKILLPHLLRKSISRMQESKESQA